MRKLDRSPTKLGWLSMVPVHITKEFWLTFSYTHVQTRQAEIKAKNPAA